MNAFNCADRDGQIAFGTQGRRLAKTEGNGPVSWYVAFGVGYRSDPFLYCLEPLLYPGDQASVAEKKAWRERRAAHKRAIGQA